MSESVPEVWRPTFGAACSFPVSQLVEFWQHLDWTALAPDNLKSNVPSSFKCFHHSFSVSLNKIIIIMVNQKLLKFFYYPDLIIIELKSGLKTTICMPNFYLLNLEYPKSKTIIGKKNVFSLKF